MADENHGYVGSDCTRCGDIDHLTGVIKGTAELISSHTSCPLTLEKAIQLKDEAETELIETFKHSDTRTEHYRALLTEFHACLRDETKYWNLIVDFRKALRAHYSCQYNDKPLENIKRALPILYRYDGRFAKRNIEFQIRHTWDELFEQMDKEKIETDIAAARFWAVEEGARVLRLMPATPYTDIVNRIGELCCERGEGRDWDACLYIIREWLTTQGVEVSSANSMAECLDNLSRWTENDIVQVDFRFNKPEEEDERVLFTGFLLRKRQLVLRQIADQEQDS